jgi:nitrite reductase (NO-forming)
VTFIQHADWNEVYNEAVETSGGYPTPEPLPATEEAEDTAPTDVEEGEAGEVGAYTIESHDIFFEPAELTIPADKSVTISLQNLGGAPHNFSIDELDISVDIAAGETGEVQINAPAGTYEFYCNVPGHREAGMVGTLIVSEDAALPEASPPSIEEEPAAESPEADAAAAEEAPAGAEPVTIESHDIFFEPAEVTIPADTDVTVSLPNEGAAPHNFSIDELEISVDLAPGETKETVINAPPGEYEYYCNVPGHREAGMVGTLIVE